MISISTKPPKLQGLLSLTDLAELAQVDRTTAYHWFYRGKCGRRLPASFVGKQLVVRARDFYAWARAVGVLVDE